MKPPQKRTFHHRNKNTSYVLMCLCKSYQLSLFLVVYWRISSNFVMADLRYLHKEHCLLSSQAGKSSRQNGNIFSSFQSKTIHPVVFSRKNITIFGRFKMFKLLSIWRFPNMAVPPVIQDMDDHKILKALGTWGSPTLWNQHMLSLGGCVPKHS